MNKNTVPSLPSLLPSFLPSFLPSLLTSFLSSLPPSFLPSYPSWLLLPALLSSLLEPTNQKKYQKKTKKNTKKEPPPLVAACRAELPQTAGAKTLATLSAYLIPWEPWSMQHKNGALLRPPWRSAFRKQDPEILISKKSSPQRGSKLNCLL